jgi:transcriptional regulator with XRE-family HTH domain
MSPRKIAGPPSPTAAAALRTFHALMGTRLAEAARDRRWTTAQLAAESGLSRSLAYHALAGDPVSLDALMRMVTALGMKVEWQLVDPRRKAPRPRQDLVHSAMGEYEARHLAHLGVRIAIDEPYQHYQFAGRADLVAWDINSKSLLHIENRTRFPDFQESAGSFAAKRAYLGASLASRLGIPRWRSETHVVAALWSSEVLHTLRLRTASFRALCPDPVNLFANWWSGTFPTSGVAAVLAVLDPLAAGRQRPFVGLDQALSVRPRHNGYVDAATKLTSRSTNWE